MSFRIKKVIGYGTDMLSALPINRDKLNFDNIESKDLKGFHEYCVKAKEKYTDLNSVDFSFLFSVGVEEAQKKFDPDNKEKIKYETYDLITYDGEFGLKEVIVFTPYMLLKHNHFDDYIADYEYRERNKGLEPSCLQISGCLYPFINLMKPANTLSGVEKYWIPMWADDPSLRVIPYVPYDIKLLLEYLELAPDHETALDIYFALRPMIYTYYS